jgi:hypothetical protein
MLEQKVDRTRAALRVTYGLVPIIAGADKFANILCDWDKYLSPLSRRLLPVRGRTFMKAVGVIEMGAGALVLSRYARLGGYVVGGWLAAIALQLVTARRYDIAVRDAVMALGAIAFARLTEAAMETKRVEEREPLPGPPIPRDEAFAMYSGT